MSLPKPNEAALLVQIRDYLKLQGFLVLRINSGGMTSVYKGKKRFTRFNDAPGCSDLIGVKDGKFYAFELKAGKNTTTALQQAFLDDVRLKGGIALVVRSIEDLEQQLREAQ